MSLNTVQEIEQAITALKQSDLEDLCGWLDGYMHPLDAQLTSDFEAGKLDEAIARALSDQGNGHVRSL